MASPSAHQSGYFYFKKERNQLGWKACKYIIQANWTKLHHLRLSMISIMKTSTKSAQKDANICPRANGNFWSLYTSVKNEIIFSCQ